MASTQRPAVAGPPRLATLRMFLGGGFLAVPEFLAGLSRDYGPISSFIVFSPRAFFIDDADAIEEVFITKHRAFKKGRGLERIRILLGDGLLTSEEPLHLQRRRLIQPAFHRDLVAGYADIILDSTREALASWHDGETRDIAADMGALTLTIALRALFGADVEGGTRRITDALTELLALFPSLMGPLGPLRSRLPLAPTRRFEAARSELDAEVTRIIASRTDDGEGRIDVLSLLLAARYDDGGRLDDRALHDELLTFLLAGYETTANALTWSLYLLALHPHVQSAVAAEARAKPGGRRAEDLPYAHAVFKEAMRLYPPAWIIGRRAIEDVEIGGTFIPKQSLVIMSPFVTHRNRRYFDEPGQFDPGRWMKGAEIPRYAYFPFGGGNRVCIGEPFAWLEGVLALSRIVSACSFAPTARTTGEFAPIVTLRPKGGMPLRVTERFG